MIIEPMKKTFGNLFKGDCFFLAENEVPRLHMKTEGVFVSEEGCTVNAVTLEDGVLHSYDDALKIISVFARVSF